MQANRETIPFGEGSFVGQIAEDPAFFALPEHDQARMMGWANSCPVVEELTDPANTAAGRGPEAMLRRYGEVNFWFGQIKREVEPLNYELYLRLKTPVLRLVSEPVGKYEPESVPNYHEHQMSPMGTLYGYALPRIFVEQLQPAGADPAKAAERMASGLSVVREAAAEARYPFDFLAMVAEGAARADADPMKVLKHIVGKGWMDEHNAHSMVEQAKRALEEHAPNLWGIYYDFTPEQRAEYRFV